MYADVYVFNQISFGRFKLSEAHSQCICLAGLVDNSTRQDVDDIMHVFKEVGDLQILAKTCETCDQLTLKVEMSETGG